MLLKLIWLILHLTLINGSENEVRNITSQIFGGNIKDILPVAFGDFNSDKLTDVIALNQDRNKISILLAAEQTFTSSIISHHTYFKDPSKLDKKKLKVECHFNDEIVESVAPGDFDGDGGMDLFVVIKREEEDDKDLIGFVMWGEHNQGLGTHQLLCVDKAARKQWHHEIRMKNHPLLIDANGDYKSDLFSSCPNSTESRCIWTYHDRTSEPILTHLKSKNDSKMKSPYHSNSYVDLDGDGNADIIVTTEKHFEIWHNAGQKELNFVHSKSVKLPEKCGDDCAVGQLAFADFDLDGKLDVLFPLCLDSECVESQIYFTTVTDLWNAKEDATDIFHQLTIDLRSLRFKFIPDDPIYGALAPRVGDIDLDGYPDLLLRMENPSTNRMESHLLLNVPTKNEDEIIVNMNLTRGFVLRDLFLSGIPDTIMATFFDLYENGKEDVILVQKQDDKYSVGAFTNLTQDSDAYFVKVIVLTGQCYHDCSENKIEVPYGTNFPGQTVCYRTQRPGLEEGFGEIESCAPQLTQTAHTALQLPYTIFGLGLAPNFLDYMFVKVTNATDRSRSHTWSQIIPNSQMYVIPHPVNEPDQWEAKLFITPSQGITLTGLALVGTCGLIMLIIVFLHWRERKADLREKLQEAHRFHFDAM